MEQNSVYHPNNITSFAVSLKAIVVKGYEKLAEAYSIYNICTYTYVIISLSLSVVSITTFAIHVN